MLATVACAWIPPGGCRRGATSGHPEASTGRRKLSPVSMETIIRARTPRLRALWLPRGMVLWWYRVAADTGTGRPPGAPARIAGSPPHIGVPEARMAHAANEHYTRFLEEAIAE